MGQLRPYPGFVGPSYTSESKIAAYDRTVNWYPEQIESGTGTARYALYPAPGYASLGTMPTSPGRAIFSLNGVVYAIGGSALYTVGGVPVLRAQGLSDTGSGALAQILGNGDAGHQLLFRADTTLYALDLNAPISEDVPLDPPSASPSGFVNFADTGVPNGIFGYAYTFVTATGETTPSPRFFPWLNPGPGASPFPGGGTEIDSIPLGVSVVTSRNVYRTEAQLSEAAAGTAQLKLVGTIPNNTSLKFLDNFTDASLGVNVPTVNTATVHVDALTVIAGITSNMIAYLDGYGISLDSARSEIRISNLFDFSTWDAIDVAQRSDAADKWQAMLVNHKEIWLFGLETTSVYFNSFGPDSPATDFPFSPIPSVFIPIGIAERNSACVVNGQPMWIGQGIDGFGVVYRANGYTPERVSTHAVENAFRLQGTLGAEGSTYQENGHVFYVLTFPRTGLSTWVYDVTEGLWHERGSFDGLAYVGVDTRGYAFNYPQIMTLSRTNGNVYQQAISFQFDTEGENIVRLRRAPHILSAQNRIRYARLRVLMEVGITTIVQPTVGSDPTLALRWSDDGGQTWGSTVTASTGVAGAYSTLVDFWQLGQGRDRIFEFRCSAPVPYRIVDCYVDYSVGPS